MRLVGDVHDDREEPSTRAPSSSASVRGRDFACDSHASTFSPHARSPHVPALTATEHINKAALASLRLWSASLAPYEPTDDPDVTDLLM